MALPFTVRRGGSAVSGAASASSFLSGFGTALAWDGTAQSGDTANCWISNTGNGPNVDGSCWYQVNLGFVQKRIDAIRLCRRAVHADLHFPRRVKVLVSTSGAFTGEEVVLGEGDISDAAANRWSDWLGFATAADGQYVRVQIHSRYAVGTGDWVAIQELEVGANDWTNTTWSPLDKSSNATLSESNKRVTVASSSTGHATRATNYRNGGGKWCYEVEVVVRGSANYLCFGFGRRTHTDMTRAPGILSNQSWGCRPTLSTMIHDNVSTAIATTDAVAGDVFTCGWDAPAGSMSLWRNGTFIDTKYSNVSGSLYPMIGQWSANSVRGRFTAADFTQPIPSGYRAWDQPVLTHRIAGTARVDGIGSQATVAVYHATTKQLLDTFVTAGDGTYTYNLYDHDPRSIILLYLFPSHRPQAHGALTMAVV